MAPLRQIIQLGFCNHLFIFLGFKPLRRNREIFHFFTQILQNLLREIITSSFRETKANTVAITHMKEDAILEIKLEGLRGRSPWVKF